MNMEGLILMRWEKWVTKQLRAYLFREIDKEKILFELKALDDDVVPTTSKLTLTPGRTDRMGSIIEYVVIKRNKVRKSLQGKLLVLEKQTKSVEKALASLPEDYCTLITRIFFTLDKEEDIREDLRLTKGQFSSDRKAALSCLFDFLWNERRKVN